MPTHSPRQVEHTITVAAPPDAVYELIADVGNWPRIFPPTIHVDYAQKGEHDEYIRIWATANGVAKNWTSRRILQPEQRRINFQQTVSAPPVASMGGAWLIEEQPGGGSLVRLLHEYRSVGDDPEGLAWIDQAVDRNSRSELAALKQNVEAAHAARDLTLSFEDSVHVDGRREDVFAFVNEANLWSQRLPHVAKVRLEEDEQGLQTLEMDTVAKDGSTHTTKSYRVTFPYHGIAYKQVTLPALLTLHTGYWTFEEHQDGGVTARSQHTVVLDPDAVAGVLGPRATVENALDYVRTALSTNSLATLRHAKAHAEKVR
ncbi:aromatase/cyclase [Streptomyces sp. B1866]|uniref:aromatase/cyclase n=1 Tax=Streptomyces sp. B1866 TaxID=3075431 RepID=UPI00288DC9AD|nr:aromatase/cyclase [Streptomyces sp. B1866]MDT3400783.1 aromatase/cyclase [Streptomyces sp. B1866]